MGGYEEIQKLKKAYNEFIQRNINGEQFLQSDKFFEGTEEKQEYWIRGFEEIAWELSRLRWEIEAKTGLKMTKYEILNGFL